MLTSYKDDVCLLVCENITMTRDRQLGFDVTLGKPPMNIFTDISI
jgi:hypothetical protein